MKKLIVTAHPSTKGFTHRIAKAFQKGSEEAFHEVEILNLYETEWRQDFLKFEDIRNIPEDKSRLEMQKKISWADELIIIHPLWWFDAPAILKNWVDQNFTPGFAYKYTPQNKLLPQKLLIGKTARVFITCDSPKWFYWLIGMPFKKNWAIGRFWFCGIKTQTFRVFDRKFKRSPAILEKWIQQVYTLAKKS
ncbi:NAD(P)H-dependent oxidoreductase [Candidatus Peregrinibacteria bacterium]|nr:NAD(P)H-dependent oxidoreductase [Candidatus Peregrinibacteria bacterium]